MIVAVLLWRSLVAASSTAVADDDLALEYSWQEGFEYHCFFQVTTELAGSSQGYSGLTVYTPVAEDASVLDAGEPRGACSGTAFAITRDGHLVTCAHVVHRATKITAHFGSKSYEAEVVAYDADCDLAILKVDAEDLACLGFFDSDKVQLAQDIRVVGYPLSDVLGESVKMSRGTVSGIIRREDENRFQIDAQVNPGNSGGPLVDEQGRVVGIASELLSGAAIDSVGFAIPGNEALRLAKEKDVAAEFPPDGPKPDGPELANRVTPAVALLKVETGPGGYADREARVLEYRGTCSENRRFGGTPDHESGKLAVDPTGQIQSFDGELTVPLVVQPVGTIGIERLPGKAQATWKSTRFLFLKTSVEVSAPADDTYLPGYGRLYPPRISPPRAPSPYGRYSPFYPLSPRDRLRPPYEGSRVETRIVPAIEEVEYKRGATLSDGGVNIAKTYTLQTLGGDDSDAKALDLKIAGNLTWDKPLCGIAKAEMKGHFAMTQDNVTVRFPGQLAGPAPGPQGRAARFRRRQYLGIAAGALVDGAGQVQPRRLTAGARATERQPPPAGERPASPGW
jgi:S1-C subfamily serine protease